LEQYCNIYLGVLRFELTVWTIPHFGWDKLHSTLDFGAQWSVWSDVRSEIPQR